MHNKSIKDITIFDYLPFLLVLFLYTFGRFAFLDLFGIRRFTQYVLLIPILLLMIPVVVTRAQNIFKIPQLSLLFLMFIMCTAKKYDLLISVDLIFSTLVVLLIIYMPENCADKMIFWIIRIAFVLSLLALIQSVILLFYPSLASMLALTNNELYSSNQVLINHPVMLMGLTTGEYYKIGGFVVTRVRSFLYEPSLFPVYFLIPGVLAFTYKDIRFKFALTILTFCIISLTGTVYMVFIAAIVAYVFLRYTPRFVSSTIPFLLALVFFGLIVVFIEPIEFIEYIEDTYQQTGVNARTWILKDAEVLTADAEGLTAVGSMRYASAYVRMAMLHSAILNGLDNLLLGVPKNLASTLGLFLYAFVYSGITGLVICCIFAYKTFDRAAILFSDNRDNIRLMVAAALFYSIFLQAFVYNDYGYNSTFGMAMVALVYRRVDFLISKRKSLASKMV